MTGFAQVNAESDGSTGFTLSLKSVNHRFLDMHFRLPSESDELEMKLRRLLKEKLVRGHVEVTLAVQHGGNGALSLNRELAEAYIRAFRTAAVEFGIAAEPDLNAILRMPGALESGSPIAKALEEVVLSKTKDALARLNQMREAEGGGIESELRRIMLRLRRAVEGIEKYRKAVLQTYADRLRSRIQDLIGNQAEPERILQEAALLVDRSDIQEELVRLNNHIEGFLSLLDGGGEVGKKLDFLLQEMNREANTLLSKTSGLAGEALQITELGLSVRADIEKAREQVQNLE
jgi:uncharacterized protein (TIGR00255 family)